MNKTKNTYYNEENNLIEDIVNPDRIVERRVTEYKKQISNISTDSLKDKDWRDVITL
jgi:hypothetical protein